MYPGCQQLWKLIRYVSVVWMPVWYCQQPQNSQQVKQEAWSRYWCGCCCQQVGTAGHPRAGPGQGGYLGAATAGRGPGTRASTKGSTLIIQAAGGSWGCFYWRFWCCRWPCTHRAVHALGAAEHHCRFSWAQGAAAGSPCTGKQIWQSPPKQPRRSPKCIWCWIPAMMWKISSMWVYYLCNAIHLKMLEFNLWNTIMYRHYYIKYMKFENYNVRTMTNQFNYWMQRTL